MLKQKAFLSSSNLNVLKSE